MKKNLLVLLVVWFVAETCFAQWTKQNVNSTKELYGVEYKSSSLIFIGANDGFIKSTDGGLTWTTLPLLDPMNTPLYGSVIYDMHFFDASRGVATGLMAGGNSETILHTTNGGVNWTMANVNNDGTWPRNLNALHFANDLTGYAVGTNGRILKSVDGGVSWAAQSSGTIQELTSVFFTSPSQGYAVGETIILTTTNGGSSWSKKNFTGVNFKSVYFPTSTTGYAVGDDGNYGNKIYKTTNAGNTWQLLPVYGAYFCTDVFFTAQDTGYVTSGNLVLKTVDGGTLWEKQLLDSIFLPNSISFLNSSAGFMVGTDGKAYKTSNAGGNYAPIASFTYTTTKKCDSSIVHFTKQGPSSPSYTYKWLINGVVFSSNISASYTFTAPTNNSTISLVVSNGTRSDTSRQFITTTVIQNIVANAGRDTTICFGNKLQLNATGGSTYSWNPTTGLSNPSIANPIANTKSTTTYYVTVSADVCVDVDTITITINDSIPATQWSPIFSLPSRPVKAIDFVNSNEGYGVAGAFFFKTSDGGNTWSITQPFPWSQEDCDIDFVTNKVGYVANSVLYKTTDGGVTFQGVASGDFNQVYFLDTLIGYATRNGKTGTDPRYICKTIDGGNTWTQQFTLSDYSNLNGLFCLNKDTCFCVGGYQSARQKIFRTTDGGQNWNNITPASSSPTEIVDVYFVDKNTGFAGKYKTTDLGNTWSVMPSAPTNYEIRSIRFTSKDIGYIGTWGGEIYQTINGGDCWQPMGKVAATIEEMCFITPSVGYFAGGLSFLKDGRIYKTSNGIVTDISNQSDNQKEYALYPNPFTSQLTISFNKKVNNGIVKIFDLVGKEIRNINFSGNQLVIEKGELHPGIYLIQVVSDNKLALTEKIVVQ